MCEAHEEKVQLKNKNNHANEQEVLLPGQSDEGGGEESDQWQDPRAMQVLGVKPESQQEEQQEGGQESDQGQDPQLVEVLEEKLENQQKI